MDNDEKLFSELRKWLEGQGFVVEDIDGTQLVDGDVLVNPTETLTFRWKIHHPKEPIATECFIYDELWEQYREVSDNDDLIGTATSIFKWMLQYYEINS